MPACPLATVLYRFDDAARFPIFESHTTAKGPVTVQADRDDAGDFIRIVYQRHEADPTKSTSSLLCRWLPSAAAGAQQRHVQR